VIGYSQMPKLREDTHLSLDNRQNPLHSFNVLIAVEVMLEFSGSETGFRSLDFKEARTGSSNRFGQMSRDLNGW